MDERKRVRGAAQPRAQTSRAIRVACQAELSDRGYSALSMEGVARRAGVGKGALYRRWPDKQSMVASVLSDITRPLGSVLIWNGDDLESDMRVFASVLDEWLSDPRIIADLIAAQLRDPGLTRAIEEALGAVVDPWLEELEARTRRRGEPSASAVAADLAGALFWRRAVLQEQPSSTDLERLARAAALGIRIP